MPWCDECSRFYNPNSLAPDGTCARCGTFIAPPPNDADTADAAGIPWHFWVLVAAIVVYLGWRLIQGVLWVSERL